MHFSGSVMFSSIASWKANAINRCSSVPQYYISVEGWRNEKSIKTAVYSIEIGVKIDEDVMLFKAEKRYSSLRGLHKNLAKTFTNLPEFPPKKIFGKNDPEFIRKRQRTLHSYFEFLPATSKVEKNQYFVEFFGFDKIKGRWTNEVQERLSNVASKSSQKSF